MRRGKETYRLLGRTKAKLKLSRQSFRLRGPSGKHIRDNGKDKFIFTEGGKFIGHPLYISKIMRVNFLK